MKLCAVSDSLGNLSFKEAAKLSADLGLAALEIGSLEQLTITSRDPAPPPLDYIPNSGGLFRDMMIHDFDMARWLLGEEPISIYSCGSCLVDPEIGKLGIAAKLVTFRVS
jgi:predicted dehydrogenase